MNRKAAQGAVAKRHGKEFEDALGRWFALQSAQGTWIDIRKQNEALKPVRPAGNGQFLAVYTKPSGCDYFGTMMGGESVVIEAKHRESDRIAQSDLTEAEKEHLLATASLGGYAMLIVELSDRKVFLLPYPLLANSQLVYGHKHIKETELIRDGYEVAVGCNLYEAIQRNSRKALSEVIRIRNGISREGPDGIGR